MSAPAALPALEVTCTGAYFIPMTDDEVRRMLAVWRFHESTDFVDDALATMQRGEVFTVPATGFAYRARRVA